MHVLFFVWHLPFYDTGARFLVLLLYMKYTGSRKSVEKSFYFTGLGFVVGFLLAISWYMLGKCHIVLLYGYIIHQAKVGDKLKPNSVNEEHRGISPTLRKT